MRGSEAFSRYGIKGITSLARKATNEAIGSFKKVPLGVSINEPEVNRDTHMAIMPTKTFRRFTIREEVGVLGHMPRRIEDVVRGKLNISINKGSQYVILTLAPEGGFVIQYKRIAGDETLESVTLRELPGGTSDEPNSFQSKFIKEAIAAALASHSKMPHIVSKFIKKS